MGTKFEELTTKYETAFSYVLSILPISITYNSSNLNQFVVDQGFAKINSIAKMNLDEKMTVHNLNVVDFLIRFLEFKKNKGNYEAIRFNTMNNMFYTKNKAWASSKEPKDVTISKEQITINYDNKPITINIDAINYTDIYNELNKVLQTEIDGVTNETYENDQATINKQDLKRNMLRLGWLAGYDNSVKPTELNNMYMSERISAATAPPAGQQAAAAEAPPPGQQAAAEAPPPGQQGNSESLGSPELIKNSQTASNPSSSNKTSENVTPQEEQLVTPMTPDELSEMNQYRQLSEHVHRKRQEESSTQQKEELSEEELKSLQKEVYTTFKEINLEPSNCKSVRNKSNECKTNFRFWKEKIQKLFKNELLILHFETTLPEVDKKHYTKNIYNSKVSNEVDNRVWEALQKLYDEGRILYFTISLKSTDDDTREKAFKNFHKKLNEEFKQFNITEANRLSSEKKYFKENKSDFIRNVYLNDFLDRNVLSPDQIQQYERIINENFPPKEPSSGGGSITIPNKQISNLMNELNYDLHLSMYVQKLLKMLIYRYLNHAGIQLTHKEYMMEMFVNMIVFSLLSLSSGDYFVCYLVDQIMIFVGMQLYLRIAQKENWKVDNNVLSGIILAPYYLVLC